MAVISKIQLPNGNIYDIQDKTSGYLKSFTETDPVFSASAASGIKTSDITNWNNKQDKITESNKLAYSLISGTPTIPTVNNATLTIQKNGNNVQTFTANQSTNATANITMYESDISPLLTKEYNNFIASGNSDPAGWYYFGKVKPIDNYCTWKVRYKVTMSVPMNTNNASYYMYYDYHGIVEFNGARQDILNYQIYNNVSNTSYRPFYNHVVYRALTAQASTAGHLLGLRFQSSANPTSDNYKRKIKIELLSYENCTVDFFDNMILYANANPTGTSYYYTRTEYNGTDNGLRETGDDNSTNQLQYAYNVLTADTKGFRGYQLVMKTANDKWESLGTGSGTGTTKTINTTPFQLGKLYYYNPWNNNEITNGNYCGTSQVYDAYELIDLRYTLNCGTTLTGRKPIYLVGTIDANGYFVQDSTLNYTQTLPTTADGKYYIYLGMVHYENSGNCYRVSLEVVNPIYYYSNNAIRILGKEKIADWAKSETKPTYTASEVGAYTKTEVDTELGKKQNTLVSGTNIKTINNQSILGSGNINISGGGDGASVYVGDTEPTSDDTVLWIIPDDTDDGCFYPIGTILHMTSNLSPASLYGGTWEKITDRFLVGAGNTYSVGDIGGETTHTLTVDEMPSHSHTLTTYAVNSGTMSATQPRLTYKDQTTTTWVSEGLSTWMDSTGGSQAHNNLPPYKAVNIWERIA